MSDEKLWKEYKNLQGQSDVSHIIRVLEKCIEESDDDALEYCANRDLGMLYAREDSGIQDTEKAEGYLFSAALDAITYGYRRPEVYDELACQTLGQLLFSDGNPKAFYFLKEALKLGSIWAAYLLSRELNERTEDDSFSKAVKEDIRKEIGDLYTECKKAMESSESEAAKRGIPQFALALIGLYQLGDGVGIDREQGMKYLKESRALGNGHAEDVLQYKELQNPKTFIGAINEMQNGTPQPKKKKTFPKALLLVGGASVILFLARNIIFAAVAGLLKIVAGIAGVAILLVCLYIYGEDGDSGSSGSGWSKPESTSYAFPNHLIDYDGNTWDLMNSGSDNANYYCSATGQTRYVHATEFDCGLPSGFYRRG